MAKAIKFTNDTYLDDSSISVSRNVLDTVINNKLFEQNGYQDLPGGLILQWGNNYSAGITVNQYEKDIAFKKNFPNSCLMVVACVDDPRYGGMWFNNGVGVLNWDKHKFRVIIKKNDLYSNISVYVRFIAIGY